jgi:hypothetical protein
MERRARIINIQTNKLFIFMTDGLVNVVLIKLHTTGKITSCRWAPPKIWYLPTIRLIRMKVMSVFPVIMTANHISGFRIEIHKIPSIISIFGEKGKELFAGRTARRIFTRFIPTMIIKKWTAILKITTFCFLRARYSGRQKK